MADPAILIGKGDAPQFLYLALANRHGLIAGATGTGKTVTLQTLAENFSRAGVPVFCADIKGDLAGLAQAAANPKLQQRAAELGETDWAPAAAPVIFWDIFGRQGHPVRATIAEMGPVLLARMLELNDTQEGVLAIAFKLADDEGLLLLDFKDLRAILGYVAERADDLTVKYGNVSKATIGTIQRRLLTLEQAGAEQFFGEPALELADLGIATPDGRGAVNILAADKLIQSPRLYATFLLWLLSELYEQLPEVGDLAKPKLVFFFDEAHLLFKDAPKGLLDKVEQVVRLVRSKAVGVYFITQNPLDVPQTVLGQLGNRVQHALRAFTPADQKAVKAAADTFRANPKFRTDAAITELAVGEALVSTLQPGGVPAMVERARICPPRSRIGAITAEERAAVMTASPMAGKYDTPVDRDSAYERLSNRSNAPADLPAAAPSVATAPNDPWGLGARAASAAPRAPAAGRAAAPEPSLGSVLAGALSGGGGRRQSPAEALTKSIARSVGSQVGGQLGRAVVRGVLGSLLKR
jgi:DNA helicase HerA-like ATPase